MCFYCKIRGATIGCCKKGCRKSFHLPCALKNNCLTQFINSFNSFCHLHHGIETNTPVHTIEELCGVCNEMMGTYRPVTSIPLTCCSNGWCHKKCLKDNAHSSADFRCPKCGDLEHFHEKMLHNGIFVPFR